MSLTTTYLNYYEINDFIGEINLDLSNDTNVQAQFESFADQSGENHLRELLDDKLYYQLLDDLDSNGEPQTTIYTELVNGKLYERPNGKTVAYEGLKRMLRYFVYAEWINYTWSSNTSLGQMISINENSTLVNRADNRKIWSSRYNQGVELYNKAFRFINDNYETYFDTNTNDYTFWYTKRKTFKGRITMGTPSNAYYRYRSSEGN